MTGLFAYRLILSLRLRRLSTTGRLVILTLAVASICKLTGASEFPERECCDELLPSSVDSAGAGVDAILRKTPPPLAGSGQGVVVLTTPLSMTEIPPHHSSEHPDTSNFLYPEFIPELSLDLGYPLPPPPPPFHPHHPHPTGPDGTNYVPTTTGTGIHKYILIRPAAVCLNNRQTGEIKQKKTRTIENDTLGNSAA